MQMKSLSLIIVIYAGNSAVLGYLGPSKPVAIRSLQRQSFFNQRIYSTTRTKNLYIYDQVQEEQQLLTSPFEELDTPVEEENTAEVNCIDSLSLETCNTLTDDLDDISLSSELEESSILDKFMSSYLGPRIVLAAAACFYGTNFPLGSIMNDAMPASASTCARMVLAALTLSPFMMKLKPSLVGTTLLAGSFTSLGYITQSLALVDTSPATVSFLGAATVMVCPLLEVIVDKKPMSWKDAPQTWISACLCLLGVGILEFYDPVLGGLATDFKTSVGIGDALALVQAFGFGTGLFLSGKMMRQNPDQSLPITAVVVATTAFLSMIWCFSDGWIGTMPGWESFTLPNMFFDPSMRTVAGAVAWTGIISTSANFFMENVALGKVPSSEASVLLATEPLWAAAFGGVMLGEKFGLNDIYGGFLIIAACLVSALNPSDILGLFSSQSKLTLDSEIKDEYEKNNKI